MRLCPDLSCFMEATNAINYCSWSLPLKIFRTEMCNLIDVKFASGIKNIHFGFLSTLMGVSTVYLVTFPEFCAQKVQFPQKVSEKMQMCPCPVIKAPEPVLTLHVAHLVGLLWLSFNIGSHDKTKTKRANSLLNKMG